MARTVTISSKGQVTLPAPLRRKYHLSSGEKALILDSGDGILIKHGRRTLRGVLRGKIDVAGLEREIRELRKALRL